MQKGVNFLIINLITLLFMGCIGDDFIFLEVEERVTIENEDALRTLGINDTFKFSASYINKEGATNDSVQFSWYSRDSNIAIVDATGQVIGVELGTVIIGVSYIINEILLMDSFELVIDNVTILEDGTILNDTSTTSIVNGDTMTTKTTSTIMKGDSVLSITKTTTTITTETISMGDTAVTDTSWTICDTSITILPPQLETKSGTINSTSSYPLGGDFTISEQQDGSLLISIASNYTADQRLPGLYVYLSDFTNSTVNAYEIGAVSVFSGSHTYTIPANANVGIDDFQYLLYFCKPFRVRVGHGTIN